MPLPQSRATPKGPFAVILALMLLIAASLTVLVHAARHRPPILGYVDKKSGVDLQLKRSCTAPECDEGIAKDACDFIYSNTIFEPASLPSGYQVVPRPEGHKITGRIVTP